MAVTLERICKALAILSERSSEGYFSLELFDDLSGAIKRPEHGGEFCAFTSEISLDRRLKEIESKHGPAVEAPDLRKSWDEETMSIPQAAWDRLCDVIDRLQDDVTDLQQGVVNKDQTNAT